MLRFAFGTIAAFIVTFVVVAVVTGDREPAGATPSSAPVKVTTPAPAATPVVSRVKRAQIESDWNRQKHEQKMRAIQSDMNSASIKFKSEMRRIDRKYEADRALSQSNWLAITNRR